MKKASDAESTGQVNIQVIVRARPLNDMERLKGHSQMRLNETTGIVEVRGKPYSFDAVHGPETSQVDFFERAATTILGEFLQGFNCSLFAYG